MMFEPQARACRRVSHVILSVCMRNDGGDPLAHAITRSLGREWQQRCRLKRTSRSNLESAYLGPDVIRLAVAWHQ